MAELNYQETMVNPSTRRLSSLKANLLLLKKQAEKCLRQAQEINNWLNHLGNSQASIPPIKKETKRILLIEDDPLTARLLDHFLKGEEVEIISVSEAEAAWEKLKTSSIDLILLDIILPGMDGFQFLRQLKRNNVLDNIPVIVISSISGEKEILQSLEMGAADYITKPFSPRIVRAKVLHHLYS